MRGLMLKALIVAAVTSVLCGCSAKRQTVGTPVPVKTEKNIRHTTADDGSDKKRRETFDSDAAASLISEARTWLGVPYLYGGNDRNGVDCSGFVLQVYKVGAEIALPRSSREQCSFCQKIDKTELTTGDLIFFSSKASKNEIAHVGIYIGDGRMIHASSSRGVMETDIESEYYVRHYVCSGRVPGFSATKKKNAGKKVDESKKSKKTVSEPVKVDIPEPSPSPESVVRNAFAPK